MDTQTLLTIIRANRTRNGARRYAKGPLTCPAIDERCGYDCFMRTACTTRPADVKALADQLDWPITEALYHLGRELAHMPDKAIVETVPGAHETIERIAREAGGWVCEQHPQLEWPHDDCPGPGMLRSDVVA